MAIYLGYPYTTGFTKEEQIQIDEKTKESRKEFSKGFVKGATLSVIGYSLYKSATSAAHAADVPAPATPPGAGAPAVNPAPAGAVNPAPVSKPGFQPLSEVVKGAFVGGATGICGVALQSGDFFLGLACGFLLIVGGIIMNRP
jgi:hypothetical protein